MCKALARETNPIPRSLARAGPCKSTTGLTSAAARGPQRSTGFSPWVR